MEVLKKIGRILAWILFVLGLIVSIVGIAAGTILWVKDHPQYHDEILLGTLAVAVLGTILFLTLTAKGKSAGSSAYAWWKTKGFLKAKQWSQSTWFWLIIFTIATTAAAVVMTDHILKNKLTLVTLVIWLILLVFTFAVIPLLWIFAAVWKGTGKLKIRNNLVKEILSFLAELFVPGVGYKSVVAWGCKLLFIGIFLVGILVVTIFLTVMVLKINLPGIPQINFPDIQWPRIFRFQ